MISLLGLYRGNMKIAMLQQFQYRVSNYFFMVGMVAEPVVYLVVWQTVARSRGGALGGFTEGDIAAYYIIWTLVRNMNIALTPYAWEGRIRRGTLSAMLLHPVHLLHFDLAYFSGWKVVVIVMWLPIALVLTWIFQPTLQLSLGHMIAFGGAIWGAFFVRFMLQWAFGLMSFWSVRIDGIFEVYVLIELLLSGKFVPLEFLPAWAQQLAGLLPFKYTYAFPIEVLMGRWSVPDTLAGFGMQIFWILFGLGVIALMWRFGVRSFSAVGN